MKGEARAGEYRGCAVTAEAPTRPQGDPGSGGGLRAIVDGLIAEHGFELDHSNADLMLHNGLHADGTVPVPASIEYCVGAYQKLAPLMNRLAPVNSHAL